MTKRYEKFEKWMIGKTVRDDEGDKGVVTREHDKDDHCVWVEWKYIGEAWINVEFLVFLNAEEKHELSQENKPIPWEVGQIVWDVRYGKGVVSSVLEDNFPVKVKFDCGGYESYTLKGSFYESGTRTLFFSEPKIEAELFPPKKPFVPVLKEGDFVFVKHKTLREEAYTFEVSYENEDTVWFKNESDGFLKSAWKFFNIGEEIKFKDS